MGHPGGWAKHMDSSTKKGPDEQYARLIEKVTDGIAVLVDGKIALSNTALSKMLDYDGQELTGMVFEELVDPSSLTRYTNSVESVLTEEREDSGCRIPLRARTGRQVDVALAMSTIDHKDELAVVVVAQNVSETLKLQKAVQESEERYSRLYQRSAIACFTLTSQGIIQDVNPAAESLLGYEASSMLKRSISSFLTDVEAKRGFDRQIISEVLQGKNPSGIELQMKHEEGRKVWVSVTANEIGTAGDPRIAFMVSDIERRKAAELREKMESERASLMLEIMTHDMNNVNQSLLFAVGLIETSMDLSPQLDRIMRETTWNVRRAARMIANLRTVIRIRDSAIPSDKTYLLPHFEAGLRAVEVDLPWKTLKVETNIASGDFEVVGNEYLESVFFNVIHNSAMFDSSEEVLVEIAVDEVSKDDMVRIEFSDHGPGISDSLKEWIFKRTGSPESQKVGRGLGLTLVDSIVDSLGGKIWVEDRAAGDHTQGAKIVILLPTWAEQRVLECGRRTCIQFFKSNHCLFCAPALEIVQGVMEEMGLSDSMIEVMNVDDPNAEVKEEDLPMLPFIRICEKELTGFVGVDEVRSGIMNLMIKPCYPD
jgi:PAS domain S-box-containing protein